MKTNLSFHEKTKETKFDTSKSRFELTLAEFPIFSLSKKTVNKKNIKAIVYEDTISGKSGQTVNRKWEALPHPVLGFGTPSTFATLFDLFQIWKENNFDHQTISFGSIYSLIKRRGGSLNKQQYAQINNDLECLVGVTIKAKNAFWDNEKQGYVDMTFHLFEHLFLLKEKPNGPATLPFGQIKASDVLYGSLLKNSILVADFDSKFFHSLKPTEQRLAWYLTKVFRSQSVNIRDIAELGKQLPLEVTELKYIKRQLKWTCDGLMKKGFKRLAGYDFKKSVDGKKEMIVFRRAGAAQGTDGIISTKKTKANNNQKEEYEIQLLVEDILDICHDEKSSNFYHKVACLMPSQDIYQALSEVKEIQQLGTIKNSPGAIFTSKIKQYAEQRGVSI